jgi:hypothetical protein
MLLLPAYLGNRCLKLFQLLGATLSKLQLSAHLSVLFKLPDKQNETQHRVSRQWNPEIDRNR